MPTSDNESPSPVLTQFRARAFRSAIASGELTARDAVSMVFDRIALREREVHAWAYVNRSLSIAEASRREWARARGELPVLAGVPVGVKDLIDTADMPTEYGSSRYRGHRPTRDAECVSSLRRAGAVIAGKTVTTELALWSTPPTRNPRRLSQTPGGSSAGSAAAVADAMVPVSVGTQTAGSVIRPASYCGVLGFVPTFGRWPCIGVKPLSPSLDRIGVFAHDVADIRLVSAALDGMSSPRASGKKTDRGWRVALMSDVEDAAGELRAALEGLGNVTTIESAWLLEEGALVHDAVMRRELRISLRAEIDDPAGLTDATRGYLESLVEEPEEEEVELNRRAERCRRRIDQLLEAYDVLVASSATGEAPEASDGTGDPMWCRLWSLAGAPSLSLPICEGPSGMPVGVQLVGARGADEKVLQVAESLEASIQEAGQLRWTR